MQDDALLVEPESLSENGSINANGRYQNALSEEFEPTFAIWIAVNLDDGARTESMYWPTVRLSVRSITFLRRVVEGGVSLL